MQELLGIIAEVAVGFTGFAALVSALGKVPARADQRLDRVRLRGIVEIGVVVVLMALLPNVLSAGATATDGTWTLCAALLLASIVTLSSVLGARNRRARLSKLEGYSRLAAVLNWSFGICAMGALMVGLTTSFPIDVAYVSALWLMTAILGSFFIRVAGSVMTHTFRDGQG
jgi:hypothetical protein